ncbi:MAG: lipoyl(octanoyl) transferase [Candidatus Marinimicrobia bacterium]|nr:lipoyl(octanoyl) transferase [Candidatus Neomarinimicrobiota bacterium]
MMNDISGRVVTSDNVDSIYIEIEKKSINDINFFWLGLQDYNPVLLLQKIVHKNNIKGNVGDIVLFLEHNHVYTLGKNADDNHILLNNNSRIDVVRIDRGGDATYHGPGQLVGYPILNLNRYKKSVSWYINTIQLSIVDLLGIYKIKAIKKDSPLVGVWIDNEKVAAIGVRLSKWVSMHGFAINVNTDLGYYDSIIPCGIFDLGVTSMESVLQENNCVKKIASEMTLIIKQKIKEFAFC